MRRLYPAFLALAVATIIHVDWHLARPTHHRLSLGWGQHWLFAAIGFAVVGWLVGRRWPDRAWRTPLGVVTAGVVLGQVVEPIVELAAFRGGVGYPSDPGRWEAFALCMAAGLPMYLAAVWMRRPKRRATATGAA